MATNRKTRIISFVWSDEYTYGEKDLTFIPKRRAVKSEHLLVFELEAHGYSHRPFATARAGICESSWPFCGAWLSGSGPHELPIGSILLRVKRGTKFINSVSAYKVIKAPWRSKRFADLELVADFNIKSGKRVFQGFVEKVAKHVHPPHTRRAKVQES